MAWNYGAIKNQRCSILAKKKKIDTEIKRVYCSTWVIHLRAPKYFWKQSSSQRDGMVARGVLCCMLYTLTVRGVVGVEDSLRNSAGGIRVSRWQALRGTKSYRLIIVNEDVKLSLFLLDGIEVTTRLQTLFFWKEERRKKKRKREAKIFPLEALVANASVFTSLVISIR